MGYTHDTKPTLVRGGTGKTGRRAGATLMPSPAGLNGAVSR